MDTILELICIAALVYQLIVFGAIVLSWFPLQPGSPVEPVRRGLHAVTEPVLGPIRRTLPPVRAGGFGLDLSPIIVLFALVLVRAVVC